VHAAKLGIRHRAEQFGVSTPVNKVEQFGVSTPVHKVEQFGVSISE
jgi:hypothetical protein